MRVFGMPFVKGCEGEEMDSLLSLFAVRISVAKKVSGTEWGHTKAVVETGTSRDRDEMGETDRKTIC